MVRFHSVRQQAPKTFFKERQFKSECLVSSSAGCRWNSWAALSTDKESQSQTGCRALWTDWCSVASQPDLNNNNKKTNANLHSPPNIWSRKPTGYVLTLFMENNSIWLFLRLKSLWTSLNTDAAPARSPVAPWHTTQNKIHRYGLGANTKTHKKFPWSLIHLYFDHLQLNRRSSTGTSGTQSSVAQTLCRLHCNSAQSCCTNLESATVTSSTSQTHQGYNKQSGF